MKPSARPLGWYAIDSYVPFGNVDSCSVLPVSMNRFSGAPLGDAYTTARPNGCPQSNTVGVGPAGGHDGASPDTPCTLKPASRTRSPCGPNANDPGWRTRNRHATWSLLGSSAH